MRKAKQIGSLALAVLTVMAMIGCGPVDPSPTTDPVPSTTVSPQVPTIEPTTAPTEVTVPSSYPTDPELTTVPTEPSESIPTTKPSEPAPSSAATEPPTAPSAEAVVPSSEPKDGTQPSTTEPPVTVPETTAPAVTEHTHSYTDTAVAATCASPGYTRHTCSCGHSYDDNETAADPNAHSYIEYVRQPTCALDGVTYYVCSECDSRYLDEESFISVPHTPTGGPVQIVEPTINQGYSVYHCSMCDQDYRTDYVNPTEEQQQAFIEAVVAATIKYINQFRVEEGTPTASVLPGLTQVAEYRAVQLQTNFAHDTDDMREATAYYQYGEYMDFAAAGRPDLVDQNYYSCHGREAIYAGNPTGTADDIGHNIASAFRGSSGHWSYVGGAEYTYIAVGIDYDPSAIGGRAWKCCILMSSTDKYG